jgi:ubiquitin-conjugating enzyme E2 variant
MVDELSEYTRTQRALEISGIVVYAGLAVWAAARLADMPAWLIAAALVAGWIALDFLSGFTHWAFDTWGSVHTPFLGKSFIRPFREHHRDPEAMTRHDFVETNGASCLAATPVLAAAAVMPAEPGAQAALHAFLTCAALASPVANQCHKWAHMRREDVPAPARLLQRWRVALAPEAHLGHHTRPFDTSYCTANGWMNGPLDATGFFRLLERAIRAFGRRMNTPL